MKGLTVSKSVNHRIKFMQTIEIIRDVFSKQIILRLVLGISVSSENIVKFAFSANINWSISYSG